MASPSSRKKFLAGNWKMNGGPLAAAPLLADLKTRLAAVEGVDVAVCPPFVVLPMAVAALKGTRIGVGAQHMHAEAKGAFTGEVSPAMLVETGCRYVILGHSERRTLFGETDEGVNRKLAAALSAGLLPIVCVGETLAEREGGRTRQVVERQLAAGLAGVSPADVVRTTIAYEPVWAIGTGRVATPEQAVEVHKWIRDFIKGSHGVDAAEAVRIQYGGSVTPENCESLLRHAEIDGALVGGASLKADGFSTMVEVARSCTRS